MKHSLLNRIVVGKTTGFIFGGLAFFLAPAFGMEMSTEFAIGLWLFYMILGSLIGFMGLFDKHPMLGFKMPWWFRGITMGVMMHLVLVLLAYDQIEAMMQGTDVFDGWNMNSPYWAMLDGVWAGLIIEWFCTKRAGEGSKLPLQ